MLRGCPSAAVHGGSARCGCHPMSLRLSQFTVRRCEHHSVWKSGYTHNEGDDDVWRLEKCDTDNWEDGVSEHKGKHVLRGRHLRYGPGRRVI